MEFNLPLLIVKILRQVENEGFEIYIIGGAVRDLLTKKPTYDWDFTTNATPEQILKIFPDAFYDNKFGTVGVAVDDLAKKYQLTDKELNGIDIQRPFEITTYRSESGYRDSRHPDKVIWGKSLEEDLKRRDFTINAMAISCRHPDPAIAGEGSSVSASLDASPRPKGRDQHDKVVSYQLIDPFHGQDDLKNKLIRAVGDPGKRFSEDALRLMRALRIAAELGFSIEPKTLGAIVKNAKTLSKISAERIRDELLKILKSSYPADGIKLLATTGLLPIILPEMLVTQGVQQAGHHTKDVWNHSLDSLTNCPSPDPIVRLATLLHDVGKPIAYRKIQGKITFYGHEVVGARLTEKIAQRLKLPKKDQEKLVTLVRFHMFAYNPEMSDAAIRRFIRNVGLENINDMMMLRIGDRLGGGSRATSWRLRELQERIGKVLYTPMQVNDLKVDGNDVMKVLNIKPGPRVGKILQKLFEEVLEDASKNKREYLLRRIKKLEE